MSPKSRGVWLTALFSCHGEDEFPAAFSCTTCCATLECANTKRRSSLGGPAPLQRMAAVTVNASPRVTWRGRVMPSKPPAPPLDGVHPERTRRARGDPLAGLGAGSEPACPAAFARRSGASVPRDPFVHRSGTSCPAKAEVREQCEGTSSPIGPKTGGAERPLRDCDLCAECGSAPTRFFDFAARSRSPLRSK